MKLATLHEEKAPGKAKWGPKPMKHVWNQDEHVGKTKKRWYNKSYAAKGPAYNWSKSGTFNGQSEGYDAHIIRSGHK